MSMRNYWGEDHKHDDEHRRIHREFDAEETKDRARWLFVTLLFLLFVIAFCSTVSHAATTVTRQGGTSDFACCEDANCTTPIGSQYSRDWAAKDACQALTEADGKVRYFRQWPMRVEKSGVVTPPPPPVANGSATLRWTPPTTNTDGSALTDLSGYRVWFGTVADQLSQKIDVSGGATATFVVNGLTSGTWYFAVASLTSSGGESANSNITTKVVP